MTRTEFYQTVKKVDRAQVQQSGGTFNAWLMAGYRQQTGQQDFRTFKSWKEAGYMVMKGASSFPIFSRPIGIIKQEAGKDFSESELHRFGVCHLFHTGQVQQIQQQ